VRFDGGTGGARFLGRRGGDRPHRGVEIGAAVREPLDIEAQSRKGLSDVLEFVGVGTVVRIREGSDLVDRCREGFLGALLTQHLESAEQLAHGLVECRELVSLAWVTEEYVEHLLDGPQVGLHLGDDLVHDQPLRRLA